MKFYLIGIKGSGMASLAHILLDEGYEVRGSDTVNYINAQKALLERKVIIDSLSSEEYLKADIIIIGHFFFNKELINKLDKYSKIYFEYHDFLSNYLDQSKLISICGSHSKTTLVKLFSISNEYNSFLIGEGVGKKREDDLFFFLESCEYQNHFLKYKPREVIITNIDYDHVDYFKNENEYIKAFQNFIENSEKVYCLFDDANKLKHKNMVTYGLNKNANYHIEIKEELENEYLLSFYKETQELMTFNYARKPNHFLELIASVLAFYNEHNYDLNIILKNISNFTLPSQRFNVEEYRGNIIINDYCHHPSQIKYNLEQIDFYYKDIKKIAIFKPDRTSRLVYFKDRFIKELEKYDLSFVLDLANTEEIGSHSSKELCTSKIKYIKNIFELKKYLVENEKYAFSFMSSKNLNDEIKWAKFIIDEIKM